MAAILPAATSDAVARLEAAGRWDEALVAALTVSPETAEPVIAAAPSRQGFYREFARTWSDASSSVRALVDAQASDIATLRMEWLIAARRCDENAKRELAGLIDIQGGSEPVMPVALSDGRAGSSTMRPAHYPDAVWGLDWRSAQYIRNTYTYAYGTPPC
jgi:hypothetical protein